MEGRRAVIFNSISVTALLTYLQESGTMKPYLITALLDEDVWVGWYSDSNNTNEIKDSFYDYCHATTAMPIENLEELRDKGPDMSEKVVYGFVSGGSTIYLIANYTGEILKPLARISRYARSIGSPSQALAMAIRLLSDPESGIAVEMVLPRSAHKIPVIDFGNQTFQLFDSTHTYNIYYPLFTLSLDRFEEKYGSWER